jgi:hypothetical protein
MILKSLHHNPKPKAKKERKISKEIKENKNKVTNLPPEPQLNTKGKNMIFYQYYSCSSIVLPIQLTKSAPTQIKELVFQGHNIG